MGDVRLTMGGEPTFVSIDDMEGDEWNTAALGPHKRRLAGDLLMRLKHRWAPGGLLHFGARKDGIRASRCRDGHCAATGGWMASRFGAMKLVCRSARCVARRRRKMRSDLAASWRPGWA